MTRSTILGSSSAMYSSLILLFVAVTAKSQYFPLPSNETSWANEAPDGAGTVTSTNNNDSGNGYDSSKIVPPVPVEDDPHFSEATIVLMVAGLVFFCFFCGGPSLWGIAANIRAVRRYKVRENPDCWNFDDLPEDPDIKKGIRTVCKKHQYEVCHGCATDYTVMNQLCYHYQYVMTEENKQDRIALSKCFMTVHYQAVHHQEENVGGLLTKPIPVVARQYLRTR